MLRKILLNRFNKSSVKKLPLLGSSFSETKEFIVKEFISSKNQKLSLKPKNSILNEERTVVHLNGLPEDWNEYQMLKYFDSHLQKIKKIIPIRNIVGERTSKVMIEFQNKKAAQSFVDRYENDYINTENIKHHLKARIFDLKQKSTKFEDKKRENQIMIYNLPFELTNFELIEVCKDFGDIENFYMPTRSENQNKGFAIVTFEKSESRLVLMQKVKIFFYESWKGLQFLGGS